MGSIPQVRRTKGYWESNYALQNECGLRLRVTVRVGIVGMPWARLGL